MAFLENAKNQLDEIEFASDRIERLEKQRAAAEQEALSTAKKLRAVREETAAMLESRMQSELSQLDMPKVRFVCQFDEIVLSPSGIDSVRFLMSANVGEALKPLSKVASGGELARIMLAVRSSASRTCRRSRRWRTRSSPLKSAWRTKEHTRASCVWMRKAAVRSWRASSAAA